MVTLASVVPLLYWGDWFASNHLKDVFFHITIHSSHWTCHICFVLLFFCSLGLWISEVKSQVHPTQDVLYIGAWLVQLLFRISIHNSSFMFMILRQLDLMVSAVAHLISMASCMLASALFPLGVQLPVWSQFQSPTDHHLYLHWLSDKDFIGRHPCWIWPRKYVLLAAPPDSQHRSSHLRVRLGSSLCRPSA